jgi:hypothetical protein
MFRPRAEGPTSEVARHERPAGVSRRQGGREATGAGAFATGAGLLTRVIGLVLSIVVAIIVAGILLVVLKANPSNSIVSEVHSWAHWLAGPFDGIFSFRSANAAIAVNWGIAAAVYVFIAAIITRLLGRTYRER